MQLLAQLLPVSVLQTLAEDNRVLRIARGNSSEGPMRVHTQVRYLLMNSHGRLLFPFDLPEHRTAWPERPFMELI